MATFTERLELLITASSTQAVNALRRTGAETENLTGKQKAMSTASTGAKNALQALGVPAEATGAALGVATGAAAAFAAVKLGEVAFDMAQHFSDATAEVRAFQRVTGATAEDASRIVAVTKTLGVDTDAAATGFFQLAKRIGQSKDTLEEHGAQVIRNKDGTVDLVATVENAATAFQNMNDPAERAAFVMENFGKGGAALIPLLSKSRAELEEFFKAAEKHHEVFSQDDLDKGREFAVSMRELNQTLEGFKIAIGKVVIPVFTEGIKDATAALETMDSVVSTVSDGVGKFGSAFGPVVKQLTGGAVDVSHSFDDIGGALLNAIPGVGVTKQIGDFFGVFDSGSDDVNKFTDAQKQGSDAVNKMNELAAAGKTNTKEYADAHRDATDAAKTLASASDTVAQSMQSEADAAFDATQKQLGLMGANLTLQGSYLGVQQALKDQAQAQHDANDAAQFGVDQSAEVEAAHIKTQQAILGVIKAAQDRAVQASGASKDSEEAHKAATDATTQAIQYMAATIPGAVDELKALGFQVVTLPDGSITVTADTAEAAAQLQALQDQLAGFIQFANTSGWRGGLGLETGGTTSTSAAPAAIAPAAAPRALTSGAPAPAPASAPAAFASSAPTFVVNVSTTGLGASVPEIQRAVVEALRGYVERNGRLVGVT